MAAVGAAVAVVRAGSWRTSCFKAEEASFIDCYLAINFVKAPISYSTYSWLFDPSFAFRAAVATVTEEHSY